MRLPSHLVAKLYVAGLVVSAACEPAYKPETCENPTVVVEAVDTPQPAVAPKYPEPKHVLPPPTQPQPQPVIKKPVKRQVWASICGHAPTLVDEGASLVRCGKG